MRTKEQYHRTVSPLEWVFLSLPPGTNIVQHIVEGDGGLAVPALAEAIAVAAEASPGMRLVRRRRLWVDSGVAPALHVLEAGSFDRDRLDSPALRRPLNGANCEVVLIPGTPVTVVFRASHALTDGRGLLRWVADVFRVLRGEPPLGADSQLNQYDLVQREKADAGVTPKQELAWPSLLDRPAPSEAGPAVWFRRTVDGAHAAASAKALAALAATTESGEGKFWIPVDLRRHDPELRSTAMLVQTLRVEVAAGDAWSDVQQRIITAMAGREELVLSFAPWLRRLPQRLLRAASAGIDRLAAQGGRGYATASVSHLGGVELADLSTADFRAASMYSLGSISPGGPVEVDLFEAGGRTEITLAWSGATGVAERAETLLDAVADALSPPGYRDWVGNRTERPLPSDSSVVQLFREQAERTPDRIALSGPEGKVTYAELSRRADMVAAELRGQGIGRNSVVGLFADRTVASIAGLWGVLRVGACYLPLDTRHPDARLAGLLADAGSSHCLVERQYHARGFAPEGCRKLVLDDIALDGPAVEQHQDADIDPGDLAYVMYTSGSTGRPKGVQIEHGALLNYLHWGTRAFEVDADTRLPLITSPSFDVSGTSVYLPLLAGGEVILLREDPNHLSLRRLLEQSGADTLNVTPSHLDLIGRLDQSFSGFRTVIVIGEQLRTEVAARAQEMFGPDCRIINEYGPTEATIGCTAHVFDQDADGGLAVVPIGLPADNTTAFLLDEERRFVAPGEIGELHLGGAQLARGYLGRPDLDRERFVSLADGTRVYRTGDLARILPSGELECAGRIDDQVKVRGNRVEPAEVAHVLEDHPAVDRAVVVAVARDGAAGKALHGYVLTNEAVAVDELERHLAARLPSYMVPSAIMVLTELPYTVSGKIDAKALPDPFADRQDETSPAAVPGPVDAIEEAVAEVWVRILRVPRSRLDGQADFHRLGGDSVALLAMLAGVCGEVLGSDPAQEEAFMAQLRGIVSDCTLERVTALASAIRGLRCESVA